MDFVFVLDTFAESTGPNPRGAFPVRHLLFHSDGWDLDLTLARDGETAHISGLVLPIKSTDMSRVYNSVVLLVKGDKGDKGDKGAKGDRGDDLAQSARLSTRGEFEFRNIPDSHLKIEVFLGAHRFTASFRP